MILSSTFCVSKLTKISLFRNSRLCQNGTKQTFQEGRFCLQLFVCQSWQRFHCLEIVDFVKMGQSRLSKMDDSVFNFLCVIVDKDCCLEIVDFVKMRLRIQRTISMVYQPFLFFVMCQSWANLLTVRSFYFNSSHAVCLPCEVFILRS